MTEKAFPKPSLHLERSSYKAAPWFCPALYLKAAHSFMKKLYFTWAFQILPLITSAENKALGS